MVYQLPGQVLRNGSGVVAKEFKDGPHIAEGRCRPPFLPIGKALRVGSEELGRLLHLQPQIEPALPQMVA